MYLGHSMKHCKTSLAEYWGGGGGGGGTVGQATSQTTGVQSMTMISSKSLKALSFSQYVVPVTVVVFTSTRNTFTSKKQHSHVPV